MEWLMSSGVPADWWAVWPVLLAGAVVAAGIRSLFGDDSE